VGMRFFLHVQTGPGAHPASCTMGFGLSRGQNEPRRGADHPTLLAPRSRKSTAIPLPLSGPWSLLRGSFTFFYVLSKVSYNQSIQFIGTHFHIKCLSAKFYRNSKLRPNILRRSTEIFLLIQFNQRVMQEPATHYELVKPKYVH
jgi:hypothetical protein